MEFKKPSESNASDFKVGDRVELHPSTDRWMMGDRFGTVSRIDSFGGIRVKLDKSGKKLAFNPWQLRVID